MKENELGHSMVRTPSQKQTSLKTVTKHGCTSMCMVEHIPSQKQTSLKTITKHGWTSMCMVEHILVQETKV